MVYDMYIHYIYGVHTCIYIYTYIYISTISLCTIYGIYIYIHIIRAFLYIHGS